MKRIGEGRENFSEEKLFPPFPKPHPSLSKDFCVYRIPVRYFPVLWECSLRVTGFFKDFQAKKTREYFLVFSVFIFLYFLSM